MIVDYTEKLSKLLKSVKIYEKEIFMKIEYVKVNQKFVIGDFSYDGIKDLTFKLVKTYNQKNKNYDANFDLYQDKFDNFVLQVFKKLPEFDEFDYGDHSFSYFIFKSETEADTFFSTIDIDKVDFHQVDEKLKDSYIYRRGLADYQADEFHIVSES